MLARVDGALMVSFEEYTSPTEWIHSALLPSLVKEDQDWLFCSIQVGLEILTLQRFSNKMVSEPFHFYFL